MMAKSWLRRTSKKFFIWLNLCIGFVFLIAVLSAHLNPHRFRFFGFFSLITPYLIFLLLLSILFWLISKPFWVIISVISLLTGWNQLKVIFAWNTSNNFSAAKQADHIRIIDWNVQSFNGLTNNKEIKNRVRLDIAESMLKLDPDIICLQEFNTANTENNIRLFSKTYPYYFFSKDYQRREGNYYSGSVIFSKFKIVNQDIIRFPNAESLLFADIIKNNDTIRIFTTHLQSFKFKKGDYEDIRRITESDNESLTASKSLMRKMEIAYSKRGIQADMVHLELNKTPYPSIICGDFNDVPNSYTYNTINNNWKDAFLESSWGIGRTFISLAPTLRIDYILTSSHFSVSQFDLIDEALSDHLMLVSDVVLKK